MRPPQGRLATCHHFVAVSPTEPGAFHMRIGLNCLHLIPGRLGGLETYLTNLLDDLRGLANEFEFVVFASRKYRSFFSRWSDQFEVRALAVDVDSTPARIFYEQALLWKDIRRHRIDLLHSSGYTAPVFLPCRRVMTVHDLNYLEIPEVIRHSHGRARFQLVRVLGPTSMRSADQIIAVSDHVGRQIEELCGIAHDRIHVLPNRPPRDLGTIATSKPRSFGNSVEPFILYVGSYFAHKNHALLFEAMQRLSARGAVVPHLVLAGLHLRDKASSDSLRAALVNSGIQDRTTIISEHLDLAELAWLYRNARCFVFPSTFEGFGIPVLEAMSAALPVICSDVPPMNDFGRDVIRPFDPRDPESLAAEIDLLWSDAGERKLHAQLGRARYEQLVSVARRAPDQLRSLYRKALGM